MTINKYVEDLGIKSGFYYDPNDERNEKWSKEREEYGFDSRETWCLDTLMIEWLYSRIKMYKEVNIVATGVTYVDFTFNNKDYHMNMDEIMDLIIKACEEYLVYEDCTTVDWNHDEFIRTYDNMKFALHVWAESFRLFWW